MRERQLVLNSALAIIRENMSDAIDTLRSMSAERFLDDASLVDELAGQISVIYEEMDFLLGARRRWYGMTAIAESFKAYRVSKTGMIAVARDLDEAGRVMENSGYYTRDETKELIRLGKIKEVEEGGTYKDKDGKYVAVEGLTIGAQVKPELLGVTPRRGLA